jgi:hypothetical protein
MTSSQLGLRWLSFDFYPQVLWLFLTIFSTEVGCLRKLRPADGSRLLVEFKVEFC